MRAPIRQSSSGTAAPLPIKQKPKLGHVNGKDVHPETAQEVWERCNAATTSHPYVARKKGIADGLRIDEQCRLVVPLTEPDGRLVSLQFIAMDGRKLTLPGPMGAGMFAVGLLEAEATVHVCEGLGQAWTAHLATGDSSVVTFGAGRMRTVASALLKHDPTMKVVLVPDAGKEADAEALATELHCSFIKLPEGLEPNTDINDLMLDKTRGMGVVAALLEAPIKPTPVAAERKQQRPTWRTRKDPIKKQPLPETALNIERIRSALACCEDEQEFGSRDDWLIVLMALHSLGWDCGFALALDWSQRFSKFKSEEDVLKTWESLDLDDGRETKRTIDSLFFAARAFGWKDDTATSAQRAVRAEVQESVQRMLTKGDNPLGVFDRWEVTEAFVAEVRETKMIHTIVAQGHMAAWVGPSGAGKTMVAQHVAGLLAEAGLHVVFFEEDASLGDLPKMQAHAAKHGYKLLCSAVALGTSTDDQLDVLVALRDAGKPLTDSVLFFDTLKKYLDLMSKSAARDFFKLLRSLTTLGMTVVMLGHTNKAKGVDGKPVFEGVGDVKNDSDEMLFFEATDADIDREVVVSVRADKLRCMMPFTVSFRANIETRKVVELERPIDVAAIRERERQEEQDGPALVIFKQMLKQRPEGVPSTELIDTVGRQQSALTHRELVACFERNCLRESETLKTMMQWRMGARNAHIVTLNPRAPQNQGGSVETEN